MQLPPVIKSLLLLNCIAFALDYILPTYIGFKPSDVFGLYFIGYEKFQFYQFFTYMFMHANFTHIFFNMFALWMFGQKLELVWGAKRFLIYYLVCGIGAALIQETGQLVGLINPFANTIGASGAVYGILLAYGMTFPEDRIVIIFPFPIPIKAKWLVCIYAVIELVEGLGMSDGVAHFAHLGGMLFGFLLILHWKGVLTKHSFQKPKNFWTQSTTAPHSKMHISYINKGNNYDSAPSSRAKDYQYNEEKKARNEEIDRILEKVRQNGYTSLTMAEKQTLFDASKN